MITPGLAGNLGPFHTVQRVRFKARVRYNLHLTKASQYTDQPGASCKVRGEYSWSLSLTIACSYVSKALVCTFATELTNYVAIVNQNLTSIPLTPRSGPEENTQLVVRSFIPLPNQSNLYM
jgi:hypothetical protein